FPWLDGALIDLTVWSASAHQALTGGGNEAVKENLRLLAAAGKLAEVRIPVIPGFSDGVDNVASTAAFLAGLRRDIPLRLQRFRSHGTRGITSQWPRPDNEMMDSLAAAARATGLLHVIQSR
ncbi:MAG TPA: glycine radical enzyme activase, partial [Symbiobacteriaceae bacterium]|nr:glycine radical enzyme activase [Symbiobacteriaceae bacterium]